MMLNYINDEKTLLQKEMLKNEIRNKQNAVSKKR